MNTIDQILQSLPSREDLASAIGLESRSSTTMPDFLPALGLFGTGMLFGAGLALMFAPKSGTEMRRDLSEGMQQWGNQAMGGYGQQTQGAYGQSGQQQGQMPSQAQRSQYGTQTEHSGSGQHYQSSSAQGTEYGRQMAGQSESQRQQMAGQPPESRTGTNPQQGTSREQSGRSPIGGSSGSRNI
jgi:gas vesicle protein